MRERAGLLTVVIDENSHGRILSKGGEMGKRKCSQAPGVEAWRVVKNSSKRWWRSS